MKLNQLANDMTSYKFYNMKQVNLYLDKKIKQVLDRCSDLAIEKLTQNVLDSVYDWRPNQYDRSYQLLEAITKTGVIKFGNTYTCEIYFDAYKMKSVINMPSEWNSHADMKNEWAGGELIYWLEYGTKDNPYYNHDEHRFIRDTIKDLKKNYIKIFKAYAKQNGMNL